jgi:hypothetical protein
MEAATPRTAAAAPGWVCVIATLRMPGLHPQEVAQYTAGARSRTIRQSMDSAWEGCQSCSAAFFALHPLTLHIDVNGNPTD